MARHTRLAFLIIFLEGYVVLACELLAMRQLIPFVGSGTEIISIIISAVLLPLAFGYHAGGGAFKRNFRKARRDDKPAPSIRKILIRNILPAAFLLMLGLSYIFLEIFFGMMRQMGITHRIIQTALYSAIFLVPSVYLLGQTVPLISNYFSRRELSEITGRMLFYSTTGSFLGSLVTTLVLMGLIGVHNTVIVTIGLLSLTALMLARFNIETLLFISVVMLGCISMNSNALMKQLNIVSDNRYNTASIHEDGGDRYMILNRSSASKISADPNKLYEYVHYIENSYIQPLMERKGEPADILIIGAGGFVMGHRDERNHYTYVDIDPDLKDVSEKYFLRKKLSANKRFEALSARAFVHTDTKRYDLIVIDTYSNQNSIPMETITREFLQEVKARLKDGGVVISNVVTSADFSDRFSVRYMNTFASVFPSYTRQIASPYKAWNSYEPANVLCIYYHRPGLTDDRTIYTDDKNTYSFDQPQLKY